MIAMLPLLSRFLVLVHYLVSPVQVSNDNLPELGKYTALVQFATTLSDISKTNRQTNKQSNEQMNK